MSDLDNIGKCGHFIRTIVLQSLVHWAWAGEVVGDVGAVGVGLIGEEVEMSQSLLAEDVLR